MAYFFFFGASEAAGAAVAGAVSGGIHAGRRRREAGLPEHRATHQQRERVHVEIQAGDREDRVRSGEIVSPEEGGAAEFNRALHHLEESDEDRNLKQQRQAASERADFVLLHELHHLLVHLGRVFLELFLDGLHLRLQLLHALHRARARGGQRPEEELDDDGDGDDGQAVAQAEGIEAVHRKEEQAREEEEAEAEADPVRAQAGAESVVAFAFQREAVRGAGGTAAE